MKYFCIQQSSSGHPPPQYPHIQAALSPNKFPGRTIVKARRPSQHKVEQRPGSDVPVSRPAATTPSSPFSNGDHGPHAGHYPSAANMIAAGKVRTASLEGSESDNSVRSLRSETEDTMTPGQVAAISSTDPTPDTITGLAEAFKPPSETEHSQANLSLNHSSMSSGGHQADTQEKPTKKKRKRCGECPGCQRKDNCGDCAPCRNEKSHQICKVRRCDRLTEKKVGQLFFSSIYVSAAQ